MMKRSYLMKDGERRSRLMILDEDARRLYMDGTSVSVTGQEFCLLKELCTALLCPEKMHDRNPERRMQ